MTANTEPVVTSAAIERLYDQYCQSGAAIAPHLPRLRALGRGRSVVEFGVKRGMSSTAWLLSADHVTSYDIAPTPQARELKELLPHWDYQIQDTLEAVIPDCDLLFLDSLHTFAQVDAELRRHADRVRQMLVFHDVTTFGEVGAVGETGKQAWTYRVGGGSVPLAHQGIRPAIDALMIRDRSWQIAARYVDGHGLLVLERRA